MYTIFVFCDRLNKDNKDGDTLQGYIPTHYEKLPLILSDKFLGFFMVPDIGSWNYNFGNRFSETNQKYGITLGIPKEFYHEDHRPLHFQSFVDMENQEEEEGGEKEDLFN